MKPYLVLLRCGPDTPHLARLENFADAAFDVALSWDGAVAPSVPGAAFVHAVESAEGGRWSAIGQTLAAHAEQLSGYSHLWLPDEDIVFDAQTVTRLFLICDQLGLELGQPAFQTGSPVSHPVALQHRDFQLRFTNHVDTSAPVLSRSMLAKVLPTLAYPVLVPEALWPRLSCLGRVAIIDAATVSRDDCRAQRTPVQPSPSPSASVQDTLLTLGGLLESGDSWCLGPQAAETEVLLQALMRSCSGLEARSLTRYLAGHLALAESEASASIRDELDRELAPVGLRFNCAAPPPPPPPSAAAPLDADPAAARALTLCQADLHDLQRRHQALQDEHARQDELLSRLALRLAGMAQEVSALSPAVRRIEAV